MAIMKKHNMILAVSALALTAIVFLLCTATRPSAASSSASIRRPHETSLPYVPDRANFCGEEAPLERQDIFECMDREIISNTFLHSNTLLVIKRSGRIFPQIEPILAEYGIPADMKYLCVAESNLQPTAKSPVGAAGLWQFMEVTAKEYGLRVNDEMDERLDVVKSTRAACRMLRANYQKLGSWTLVAASYNGGLTRVRKNIEQQRQADYYDIHWAEETRRYVFRIMALKAIMTSPSDYGFDIGPDDMYRPYDTREVQLPTPIADLPQWAKDNGTTYRALRLLNPWLLRPQLKNAQDTLTVLLPKE